MHKLVPESAVVVLPDKEITLVYTRLGSHPVQAEYTQSIEQTSIDGSRAFQIHPLARNPGGGTAINLYWIVENGRKFVRFEDQWNEHVFDLSADRLYLLNRHEGKIYSDETTIKLQNEDGGSEQVGQFVPIDDLLSDWHGEYLGVITGGTSRLRFVSSKERPESPTDKSLSSKATDILRKKAESYSRSDR